jgi:hypothetical protein
VHDLVARWPERESDVGLGRNLLENESGCDYSVALVCGGGGGGGLNWGQVDSPRVMERGCLLPC